MYCVKFKFSRAFNLSTRLKVVSYHTNQFLCILRIPRYIPATIITIAIKPHAIFPKIKGLLITPLIHINSINVTIATRTKYLIIFGIFLLVKKSAIYGSTYSNPPTTSIFLIPVIQTYLHVAFLYEITICAGANNSDATINNTDLLMIPLNRKITAGIPDSANALKTVFFRKQIIHITQYSIIKTVFPIKYSANASSDHQPNQVPGILTTINPKHPNLPVCSAISTPLLLHLFSNPSLHLTA